MEFREGSLFSARNGRNIISDFGVLTRVPGDSYKWRFFWAGSGYGTITYTSGSIKNWMKRTPDEASLGIPMFTVEVY